MEVVKTKKKCNHCGGERDYLQKVNGKLYYASYCTMCKPIVSSKYYYDNHKEYLNTANKYYRTYGANDVHHPGFKRGKVAKQFRSIIEWRSSLKTGKKNNNN